jgi:hypothetical protein
MAGEALLPQERLDFLEVIDTLIAPGRNGKPSESKGYSIRLSGADASKC